jgi:hypothetical protein
MLLIAPSRSGSRDGAINGVASGTGRAKLPMLCKTIDSDGRDAMAVTRMIQARVPESLEARARASSPELAGLDISHLVRVALAALAGQQITDAIPAMRRRAGNPGKQRAEASA